MSACQVCQGPHRQVIEDALMVGTSVRTIAEQFSVSKSAIGRHRTNCLQPKVKAAAHALMPAAQVRSEVDRAKAIVAGAAPTPSDVLSLSSLLERLARSLERLEGAADTAASESLHTPLAALSSQLHQGIATAAKIQGLGAAAAPEGARFSIVFNPSGASSSEGWQPGMRDVTPPAEDRAFTIRFGSSAPPKPPQADALADLDEAA